MNGSMKLIEINPDAFSKFFDDSPPSSVVLEASNGKRYKAFLKSSEFDIDSGTNTIEFEAKELL